MESASPLSRRESRSSAKLKHRVGWFRPPGEKTGPGPNCCSGTSSTKPFSSANFAQPLRSKYDADWLQPWRTTTSGAGSCSRAGTYLNIFNLPGFEPKLETSESVPARAVVAAAASPRAAQATIRAAYRSSRQDAFGRTCMIDPPVRRHSLHGQPNHPCLFLACNSQMGYWVVTIGANDRVYVHEKRGRLCIAIQKYIMGCPENDRSFISRYYVGQRCAA